MKSHPRVDGACVIMAIVAKPPRMGWPVEPKGLSQRKNLEIKPLMQSLIGQTLPAQVAYSSFI